MTDLSSPPLPDSTSSPVVVSHLTLALRAHPDRQLVAYLLCGFMHGFNLGFRGVFTDSTRGLAIIFGLATPPARANKLLTRSLLFVSYGVEIVMGRMEARLPPDKLISLCSLLSACSTTRTVKKGKLLSIIGKLSFVCKVVKPGRLFLRRLIDLPTTQVSLEHYVTLDPLGGESSCPPGMVCSFFKPHPSPRPSSDFSQTLRTLGWVVLWRLLGFFFLASPHGRVAHKC